MTTTQFINTSTDPDSGHVSDYIREIEVNMTGEPLKVEQPLLESSSEMDKQLPSKFHRHQNYCNGDKLSYSSILSDGEFQLTEPWSAKILVEEAQKCNTLFPRSHGKTFPEKSLNICKDPCRSAVVLT